MAGENYGITRDRWHNMAINISESIDELEEDPVSLEDEKEEEPIR